MFMQMFNLELWDYKDVFLLLIQGFVMIRLLKLSFYWLVLLYGKLIHIVSDKLIVSMPHIFAHMKQVSYSDLHNKGA